MESAVKPMVSSVLKVTTAQLELEITESIHVPLVLMVLLIVSLAEFNARTVIRALIVRSMH